METNAFASLAVLQLPSASRLLASACCPDKDLVVLISRLGGQDRMSLWKMQGPKTWEVDIAADKSSSEQIVGLAWSPDGQSIAVAHDPPRITLHSVQDGREERSLTVTPLGADGTSGHIAAIWWFQQEKKQTFSSIPDIFKRNNIITGSAHSILKTLPLLDNLQEDSQKLTATDLFAFQGSQTRATPKSSVPDVIESWPALHPDLLAASISSSQGRNQSNGPAELVDEADDTNFNSILAVSDDVGSIHCFLDGSFPLGAISLKSGLSTTSLFKDSTRPIFFAHPKLSIDKGNAATDLLPTLVELPLLGTRKVRDLAQLSSTARELMLYIIRVTKDMRDIWFGSESFSGARELGPKWVRALEEKQRDHFEQEDIVPVLDLTCLLVTGRSTEPLHDFLGSAEQMSERSIQHWETTVSEALIKLRDLAEKRIAPACQRLHLVLEEIRGWSQLPPYASFELSLEDTTKCVDHVKRAIVMASWLAAVSRRELVRFKEFILWLRYETTIVNPTNDTTPIPRHDILEVNNYFISGLVVSSIDKWFMGPVPHFNPDDLGVPEDHRDVPSAVEHARNVSSNPVQMAWQANIGQKDLSHLDRNLDALTQELAILIQRVFVRASAAASRSAVVSFERDSLANQQASARLISESNDRLSIRERIIKDENEVDGNFYQYLAVHVPSGPRSFLCLVRIRYGAEVSNLPLNVGIALLECCIAGEEGTQVDLELLEAEFFDDECVVIVYRLRTEGGPTYMATTCYNDLGYQEHEEYVSVPTREDLILGAMERWKEGHLPSVRIPIKRCRRLARCDVGPVSLSVNGRAGRRVACVLDRKGTSMECLDLEGDVEDMEGEGDPEEDNADEGETS